MNSGDDSSVPPPYLQPSTATQSRSNTNSPSRAQQQTSNNNNNNNNVQQPTPSQGPASSSSHQQFLYHNSKSPIPQRTGLDANTSFHNMSYNQNPYPGPEALPFSPVPLQQSLQDQQALLGGGGAGAMMASANFDANNINGASRHMYTAAITKLRTQLDDSTKQLHIKTSECETLRRELSQRDREATAATHAEIKSRIDAERSQLVVDHTRTVETLRGHYETMVEQLNARVKTAEAESEEMRLRVAAMTSKTTEAQAASGRDRQALEAMQKRYEADLVMMREHHDKEVDNLRKEVEVARTSNDGRDRVATSQVSSLQSDIKRLQSELEQTRVHEGRLQGEREDDARRWREERESAQRESEAAIRRLNDRVKSAEANERDALDRALRAERGATDERARRERLQEEVAGLEQREHEAVRNVARREAEVARLEARVEALNVKANAYATEASAVRHEFEVRDSRDRQEEKMAFENRLSAFRDRSQSSRYVAQQQPSALLDVDDNGGGDGGGGHTPPPQQRQPSRGRFNNNNLVSTPGVGYNNNNNNYYPVSRSGVVSSSSRYHHRVDSNNSSNNNVAVNAFQEALDVTNSEIRDLKRALSQLPKNEYNRRGAIETRIEDCLEEIKRLNERVSRSEAAGIRERATAMTAAAMAATSHPHPTAAGASHQQDRNRYVRDALSPAMKDVESIRNELNGGGRRR